MNPIFNDNKLKTLEERTQHWIFPNLLMENVATRNK